MLPLEHLFENFHLAKEALSHWDHEEEGLEEALGQFRISSNAVYPFPWKGERCYLRLAPLGEKQERNVRGEMEFLQYLRGEGYPCLEPLTSREGELCLELSTQWGPYWAAAFRQVPGEPLEDAPLTDQALLAYGRALGRLHALSQEYRPQVAKWSHREALGWAGEALSQCGAPDFAHRELEQIRSLLEGLPASPEAYGLVHYDFELDNVFYSRAQDACWAIDFDDGMYHWYALDVEQAIDSLGDRLEGEDLERAQALFLQGYRQERPYPPEMDEARPLLRRFIDLYGYARLIRCVQKRFPQEPQWMAQLREKLDGAIQSREAAMKARQAC